MPIWLICLLWYVIGCWGFIYWWRKDLDFTIGEIPVMLLAGCVGPFSWILGHTIHGDLPEQGSVTIFKKKK